MAFCKSNCSADEKSNLVLFTDRRNWFIPLKFNGSVEGKKRETVMSLKSEKSHGSHQRPHTSQQVPTQIEHTALPRNNKRILKCNPINSFVNHSRYFPYRPDDVHDVWPCFFSLFVCVSLDFRAADVAVHDWMVMSSLWKASVFLLQFQWGMRNSCAEKAGAPSSFVQFLVSTIGFLIFTTLQRKIYLSK